MKKLHDYIITLILILAASMNSYSQYSFNGTSTPTVTVSSVLGMSVTANSSYTISFNTVSQISSGITISNLNTFAIKSNVPWKVSVAASTATFSNTGTYSSANMPASVLTFSVTGTTGSVVLSTTAQNLAIGNKGDATVSGNTFGMNLNANPGFSYGPGNYVINVVYTLAAQ